jgi:hypothetical protein
MKRTSVAILCAIAFLIGTGAGAYAGFNYASSILGKMSNSVAAANAAAAVNSSVRLLELIRGTPGDDAMNILESRLDNHLMVLGSVPRQYLPSGASETLRGAAAYRAKYPHKSSSPEVEAAVERALASGR